jgi:hypothetical protein
MKIIKDGRRNEKRGKAMAPHPRRTAFFIVPAV